MKVKDTHERKDTRLGYSNLLLHMKQAVPTTMSRIPTHGKSGENICVDCNPFLLHFVTVKCIVS